MNGHGDGKGHIGYVMGMGCGVSVSNAVDRVKSAFYVLGLGGGFLSNEVPSLIRLQSIYGQ